MEKRLYKYFGIVVVAGGCLFTGSARAQTYPDYYSGSQMSELCIKNSPVCFSYVAGVADFRFETGMDSIGNGRGNGAAACITAGYPLSKMVAKIREFIISHPYVEQMQSGSDVVGEALSDSFPCSRQTKSLSQ